MQDVMMREVNDEVRRIMDSMPKGWAVCKWTPDEEKLIVKSNMRAFTDEWSVSQVIENWKQGGVVFVHEGKGSWVFATNHIDKLSVEVHGGKWSDENVDDEFKDLVVWMKETWGLATVLTLVPSVNEAAQGIVERVGFEKTGLIPMAGRIDGAPFHKLVYAFGL